MEPTFQVIPLNRYLAVEARGARPTEDGVRGVVLAVGWWTGTAPAAEDRNKFRTRRDAGPPALSYLVSDVRLAAPVWVKQEQIERQTAHSPFDLAAPAAAAAPAPAVG